MRRTAIAALLLLSVFSFAAVSENAREVSVPLGSAPTLDGTLADAEWDDACAVVLDNGVSLFLKHSGRSLFLGVRGQPVAIVSPCFLMDNEIRIVHVSGSLGTVAYEQREGQWSLSQSATWDCQHETLTADAERCMASYLDSEGWTAPNGRIGTPTEYELQVVVPCDSVRMLFLYMVVQPERVLTSWPCDVSSDPVYLEVARAAFPPDAMAFDTEQWVVLHLRDKE